MKVPKIDPALLLTISVGEVGAYALIPKPEQATNESKGAIPEVAENMKAHEREKAMRLRDVQRSSLT